MPLPRLDRGLRLRTFGVAAVTTALMLPTPAFAEPRAQHRVERGETLSEIAVKYGVRTNDLARANGLSNPDQIFYGRSITLPGSATAGSHRVSPGETLSQIAKKYGVSTAVLAAANNVDDPHHIRAGGRLQLPVTTGAPASAEPTSTVLHTVAAGQTLSGIARRYRVPSAAIAAVNGLRNRNHIESGTRLKIPVTGRPEPDVVPRSTVEQLIESSAKKYGWDANLVKAIAWQESGWNNDARSSVGAVGIMQVLPSTNREISQPRGGRSYDLTDPAQNIEAGMQYLELMYELTDGDAEKILAGYYQGLRSVRKNGRYESTEKYIANILALWDRFEANG